MSLPVYRVTNGWREILARIFDGFTAKPNVTPEWLVNPATNRRLKLDLLYPDIGVAVRFEGQQGQQRRRLSLEEEEQQRVRFDARVEVCWQHGIQLVVVDVVAGKAARVFQQLDTALSRAAEVAPTLRRQIVAARRTASGLSLKIRSEDDLALYADLWTDRQYQLAEPAGDTPPPAPAAETFAPGAEVEHTHFGPGVVTAVQPSGNDTLISVDFVTAGQKTLAASLVAGKLRPKN
ncbi:MAG: hypothetical protein Kow0031_00910 [Anaerolineae bacterium]